MDEFEQGAQDCPPKGAPMWMVTFGDMMSLLLTFFILLLSFSTMEVVKFKQALGSLKEALGVKSESVGDKTPSEQIETKMVNVQDQDTQDQTTQRMINYAIKKYGMEEDAQVVSDARGIIVRVNGSVFFDAGTANIKKSGEKLIRKVLQILKKFKYELQIEGHTDNTPIRSPVYPSNWELSAARAASVLRFILKDPAMVKEKERLSIIGRADTQPLVPNNSPENKAKNRRIEFVFVKFKI